ncbi:MAG: hypothetical protein AMK71_05610 [Nitrospira bacterium SG8_35_4]|nr:MAG: hypothetical protein AMK71_05610 [Nitrospira bacterium SG8_35_4]
MLKRVLLFVKSAKETAYFWASDMMSFSCFIRMAYQKIKLTTSINNPMAMMSFAAIDFSGWRKFVFMLTEYYKRLSFFLEEENRFNK